MAGQMEIEFISEGFKEILNSDGVRALVESEAEKIAAKANSSIDGDGFVTKVWKGGYGGGRWVASVMTSDRESVIAESEDKVLTKAVK